MTLSSDIPEIITAPISLKTVFPLGRIELHNTDHSYNPDTWVKRPIGGVNENNEYIFIERDSRQYNIKDYAMDPTQEEKVSSEEFNNLFKLRLPLLI